MTAPDVELTPNDLESLPVFPLPHSVLFPGAILPLHVFEPRYRDMTRDVLAERRILAVARLRPGFEASYQGRPPIFEVCGVGVVTEDHRRADGRYDIVLRGLARVRLAEELTPHRSYRRFRAERLVEPARADLGALAALQHKLSSLWERLRPHLPPDARELSALLSGAERPGERADRIAEALVADPDERQALLEELDPTERFSRLVTRLDELVSALTPGRASSKQDLN